MVMRRSDLFDPVSGGFFFYFSRNVNLHAYTDLHVHTCIYYLHRLASLHGLVRHLNTTRNTTR